MISSAELQQVAKLAAERETQDATDVNNRARGFSNAVFSPLSLERCGSNGSDISVINNGGSNSNVGNTSSYRTRSQSAAAAVWGTVRQQEHV